MMTKPTEITANKANAVCVLVFSDLDGPTYTFPVTLNEAPRPGPAGWDAMALDVLKSLHADFTLNEANADAIFSAKSLRQRVKDDLQDVLVCYGAQAHGPGGDWLQFPIVELMEQVVVEHGGTFDEEA
jgi:hypothetical protein